MVPGNRFRSGKPCAITVITYESAPATWWHSGTSAARRSLSRKAFLPGCSTVIPTMALTPKPALSGSTSAAMASTTPTSCSRFKRSAVAAIDSSAAAARDFNGARPSDCRAANSCQALRFRVAVFLVLAVLTLGKTNTSSFEILQEEELAQLN